MSIHGVSSLRPASANSQRDNLRGAIFRALAANDDAALRHALEQGADPNETDARGNCALNYALSNGLDRAALILAAAAGQKFAKNPGGWGPLCLCVYRNNHEALRAALENGADPNETNGDRVPALCYALSNKDEISALLLAAASGQAFAKGPGGWGPVCLSIYAGKMKALIACLENGADPNETNGDKIPALNYAISNDQKNCALELARAKGQKFAKNSSGWGPLCLSVYKGMAELTQAALEAGCDPNETNGDKIPALNYALSQHSTSSLAIASAKGQKFAKNPSGWGPVCLCVYHGEQTTLQACLENGADPNETNGDKIPALNFAMVSKSPAAAVLAAAPSQKFERSPSGWGPVCYAVHYNNSKALLAMLGNGADPNETNPDKIPALCYALGSNGSTESAKILAAAEGQSFAKGPSKWGPVNLSIHSGDDQMLLHLLRHGADPAETNANGANAADFARSSHPSALQAIERFICDQAKERNEAAAAFVAALTDARLRRDPDLFVDAVLEHKAKKHFSPAAALQLADLGEPWISAARMAAAQEVGPDEARSIKDALAMSAAKELRPAKRPRNF